MTEKGRIASCEVIFHRRDAKDAEVSQRRKEKERRKSALFFSARSPRLCGKRASLNRALVLLLALIFAPSIANAQEKLAELRWGGDAEGGAPYLLPNPKNPREIIGFEVDLMDAVGKRLNRKSVFVQNQWDGLIPGLQRGNYDLAVNGIEITDDRRQQVNFSIPYYTCGEQLSVRAGDNSINSLAELKGKVVGTLKASLAQRILERANLEQANLEQGGGIQIRSYENQNNAYDDLALGRLQAVLMDWPIAVYYSKPNPKLKFAAGSIGRMEYGAAARKEDAELLKQVNDALLALIKSGELRRIYEKWGIWNSETDQLFARISSASQPGQVYEEFTQNITKKLTWRERLERYKSYLPPLLLIGAPMTLLISVLGMAVAIVIGLAVALIYLYAPRPASWLARSYVELFRGTPLLIQLYLIFYGLPNVGLRLSPLLAAVVGLGLNYGAYEAENYRAGIEAIPRGQMEAALSLGMTRAQSLRHVIVPQAMRLVIPPVTNDFIALFKDSSIVSVITMVELTKVYGQLASTYYDYIGAGVLTAAIYFLMGLPFVRLARWVEKRLATDKRVVVSAKRRWFGPGTKPVEG
ncbi:MAG: ABC transporter substrate-binding protein/permease [Blastocatellia bacterium]|nr:ABC transporter substrate-binding protein/permease [Blastocatellia bacterium]